MAYNSDGYIMIDFSEVDFRKTNQTIDGLYQRCVDVIGTNKFILVINANGRTPMPSTCSYINNQYVIDSFIYLFSITSNDNIFIRRNDVPASDIINDSVISVDKTWSSNKIDNAISSKQDELTAGDNISILNNIISANGIKSFTYTGDGELIKNITFNELPLLVFITATYGVNSVYSCLIPWGLVNAYCMVPSTNDNFTTCVWRSGAISFNGLTMTLENNSAGRALNNEDVEYTVYYLPKFSII